jgi:hypothetical protein
MVAQGERRAAPVGSSLSLPGGESVVVAENG